MKLPASLTEGLHVKNSRETVTELQLSIKHKITRTIGSQRRYYLINGLTFSERLELSIIYLVHTNIREKKNN